MKLRRNEEKTFSDGVKMGGNAPHSPACLFLACRDENAFSLCFYYLSVRNTLCYYLLFKKPAACGGVVGLGAALQAGSWRVRFLKEVIGILL